MVPAAQGGRAPALRRQRPAGPARRAPARPRPPTVLGRGSRTWRVGRRKPRPAPAVRRAYERSDQTRSGGKKCQLSNGRPPQPLDDIIGLVDISRRTRYTQPLTSCPQCSGAILGRSTVGQHIRGSARQRIPPSTWNRCRPDHDPIQSTYRRRRQPRAGRHVGMAEDCDFSVTRQRRRLASLSDLRILVPVASGRRGAVQRLRPPRPSVAAMATSGARRLSQRSGGRSGDLPDARQARPRHRSRPRGRRPGPRSDRRRGWSRGGER